MERLLQAADVFPPSDVRAPERYAPGGAAAGRERGGKSARAPGARADRAGSQRSLPAGEYRHTRRRRGGEPRLYDFCEQRGLSYLIGIEGYEPFKSHTRIDLERMRERHERTGRPARHFSSLWHQAGSWPGKRRVVYKVEVNCDRTSRRFAVTNMKGLPIHLYRLYCDRGTCETYIDEMKNALWADRLSCVRFVANAFRLLMCALAYNLLQVYRGKLCDTALAGASIETIRSRLLKVGARVRQTARRVWVHIASGFPYREVLVVVLGRVQAMPNAPPAVG